MSRLTKPMRDRLWTLAQHKFGWGYVSRRELVTCRALEHRGLVEVVESRTHGNNFAFALTEDAGRREVERRWPISPFVVGSYELPVIFEHEGYQQRATEWDRRDKPLLMADGMTEFWPGIQCHCCHRFVGTDGSIEVEHFEMSRRVASVDGTCGPCLRGECPRNDPRDPCWALSWKERERVRSGSAAEGA